MVYTRGPKTCCLSRGEGWPGFVVFVNFLGVKSPTMADPINVNTWTWEEMYSNTPLLFPS